MTKQNVLVVGGAGFIGHHVVRLLKDLGHTVFVFDAMTSYGGLVRAKELDSLMAERIEYADMAVWKGDIESLDAIVNAYGEAKPDIVIQLASLPNAKTVNAKPTLASSVMLNGMENLLEACCFSIPIGRFVFVSSSMVYGDFKNGVCEADTPKPGNLYATYKLAGEQLTKLYADIGNFDYTIVRPSAVYGPRDVSSRVVGKFFEKARANDTLVVNGHDELLDFSYVTDVADGIVRAALSKDGRNNTFNVTRGSGRSILDAAFEIRRMIGQGNIHVVEQDETMPSRGALDINKARRLLKYDPQITIEQGLYLYYEWLKNSILRNQTAD